MKVIKEESFEIEYLGNTITVLVKFKTELRRINYRAKYLLIEVSAPARVSLDYIKKSLTNIKPSFMKAVITKKDDLSNLDEGYIYLLGVKRRVCRIDEKISDDDITYRNQNDLNRKIKSYALATYERELRKYEDLMDINKPYNLRVQKMTSRYGSNSRQTHTICLNLNLIHYNINVIDSVIVHELAHHYHFDHSNRFYNVVYKYCPNYDIYQRELKKGAMQ